ncbi:MAG: 6,7-dimethyl-8-ribityllumazine synthase [Bdellovibrio sp. CG10_big_fil_rev_8_21_14_0_10_47_8]|nr:MAG: 6,7-dimethyl-8-ribityllumazine synthase [Bdellovibrio sp. CG10_big_fil_rev_8_21_14_0_10_47_8]
MAKAKKTPPKSKAKGKSNSRSTSKSLKQKATKKIKVGVVTSRFNSEVTEKLEEGAFDYLANLDQPGLEVLSVQVPGAVEIPLAIQALFEAGCQGVVALGAVIRGDTSHYDVVCNSVERGVTALMLEYRRPIGFGVLTTDTEEQAMDRAGGKLGNKGAEAAEVTIEMMGLLEAIK